MRQSFKEVLRKIILETDRETSEFLVAMELEHILDISNNWYIYTHKDE